ncbi:MAG: hypothetical protein ACLQJR_35405 [Stellaceae bacterium]
MLLQLGYPLGETAAAQPIAKKPKSKGKLLQGAKRGGVAGGKRGRMRADKPRRAGGGDIQVEPLPPPSRTIPGTDIPDHSQSEEANIGTTHEDTDLNMPNAFDTSPDKDIDKGGWPRVDPDNYPGIVNTPIRGSHKPRTMAPYRR